MQIAEYKHRIMQINGLKRAKQKNKCLSFLILIRKDGSFKEILVLA